MNKIKQIIVAVFVGVVVAGGAMMKDKMTNAEWVVSPEQIAQAKADMLPVTWIFFGLAAGAAAFVVARRKSV